MKFLIDRCAGHRIAEFLEAQGHDVSELSKRGTDPGDRIVLQWATEEDRVLVTMDKDFGKLVYLEGQTHCGIIRFARHPSVAAYRNYETAFKRSYRSFSRRLHADSPRRQNPHLLPPSLSSSRIS